MQHTLWELLMVRLYSINCTIQESFWFQDNQWFGNNSLILHWNLTDMPSIQRVRLLQQEPDMRACNFWHTNRRTDLVIFLVFLMVFLVTSLFLSIVAVDRMILWSLTYLTWRESWMLSGAMWSKNKDWITYIDKIDYIDRSLPVSKQIWREHKEVIWQRYHICLTMKFFYTATLLALAVCVHTTKSMK